MNISRDIQPISNLKRKTAELLRQLEETGDPVVLTRNGEPCIVVQNAAAYQELLDLKERFETIVKTRRGIEDVKRNRTRPAEKVLAALDRKHGL